MQTEAIIKDLANFSIAADRKDVLEPLVDFLKKKIRDEEKINLNFICTHNSRRSQFAQFWSFFLSAHFHLDINSYSGGTEVTACHPNTIASLERSGFSFTKEGDANPRYHCRIDNGHEITLFSKLDTDSIRSEGPFAALMCCSHAGENCPFVPGTEITVPLYYEDPKYADGTEEEKKAYDSCSLQIASEIYRVFKQLCE